MITISLCMIVKNEEIVLQRCLDTIADLVDEINIIDTGSIDKTKEIAGMYTSRIYDFEWRDNFSEARNFAFNKATKEYIMWLDADDVLMAEDREKFIKLKEEMNMGRGALTFKYYSSVDKNNKPLMVYRRIRLVRRDRNYRWVGFIHEYIEGPGDIEDVDLAVTHLRNHTLADRNLKIYQRKLEEGVLFTLRDRYYYGKELYYHGFYQEAINELEPLLEEAIWVEEKIDSACKIALCYQVIGNIQKSRDILFKTFEWAMPRAEVLYSLGYSFEVQKKYQQAIFWYKNIENAILPTETRGFIDLPLWTFKHYIQLCKCYYTLGEYEIAYDYHKKAYEVAPEHPMNIYNENFFQSKLKDRG